VVVGVELDPFLSMTALAGYSGLSVRKLREYLTDALHPLPHYRVGGKILIRRSEFDAWMDHYRATETRDLDGIVDEALQGVR
jgi:excisionase family DNA binding protein